MNKKNIVYFEKAGKENRDDCIKVVKERLKEGDIKYVLVASSTGETALKLYDSIKDLDVKLICVTYNAGYKEEYKAAFDKNVPEFEKKGISYVRATHCLSAGERSVNKKYSGTAPLLLIADTYRTLSQGLKVAVEISLMATDAGKVPSSEKIISIGGSSKGCDSAVVIRNSYSHTLLQDLAINEILCMPFSEE